MPRSHAADLHNTAARLAQSGEPAQAGSKGVGVNRHGRSDSRASRACRLLIALIIVIDHGLGTGSCRAGSPQRFSDGPVPVSRLDEAYAVRQVLLNRAENRNLRRVKSTAVRIDHRLGDLPDLDMAVLRRRTISDQARSGLIANLWASKPVATPICCRRASASLSCAISASNSATRELVSGHLATKPAAGCGGARPYVNLDDVRPRHRADTDRKPLRV